MKAAGIVTYGTDLVNPDFAGIARAAGLFGARVEKASELDDALRGGVRPRRPGPGGRPAPPGRNSRCRPSSPTARSRASPCTRPGPSCPGEGSELIELTKTNLRQLEHRVTASGASRSRPFFRTTRRLDPRTQPRPACFPVVLGPAGAGPLAKWPSPTLTCTVAPGIPLARLRPGLRPQWRLFSPWMMVVGTAIAVRPHPHGDRSALVAGRRDHLRPCR